MDEPSAPWAPMKDREHRDTLRGAGDNILEGRMLSYSLDDGDNYTEGLFQPTSKSQKRGLTISNIVDSMSLLRPIGMADRDIPQNVRAKLAIKRRKTGLPGFVEGSAMPVAFEQSESVPNVLMHPPPLITTPDRISGGRVPPSPIQQQSPAARLFSVPRQLFPT